MEAEELLAFLIGWVGRSVARSLLQSLVERAVSGGTGSPTGCVRWPDQFDADELGLDPEEDDQCRG